MRRPVSRSLLFAVLLSSCTAVHSTRDAADAQHPISDAAAEHPNSDAAADVQPPNSDAADDAAPVVACSPSLAQGEAPECGMENRYCCAVFDQTFTCSVEFFGVCREQPVGATVAPCSASTGQGCTPEQPICCVDQLSGQGISYCTDHLLQGGNWSCSG